MLLVREAGGFVTDFRGAGPDVRAARISRGNGELHSRCTSWSRERCAGPLIPGLSESRVPAASWEIPDVHPLTACVAVFAALLPVVSGLLLA
jgi:hypothetical protein